MRYSEPLGNQLGVFFVFLGVGFLLGFCYEVLLFAQKLLSEKNAAVLVRDLLFCFVSFTVLFCAFLGYTNGVWRLPLLISGAAGFFVFEWSLGNYLRRLLSLIASIVSRVLLLVLKPVLFVANRLRQTAQKGKKAWNAQVLAAKEKLRRRHVSKQQKKRKKAEKEQKNTAEIENNT